ncbi:hypothetical protein [Paracoccus lutimaris]|uniref:Uncharacterized protein n=1 Tax=Paracoccus lutimaris TaxID=1490030 RepID=A0A368Z5W0_9RHOB|nr:hypothetical protein [Paracoccus lutimaris]RCW87168.1 hypothetical protein DFP89_103172 [Paracoccus lutimaris]
MIRQRRVRLFAARKPARITDIGAAAPTEPSENFSERRVGMTFNMPESRHKRFKMAALQSDMSMREPLIRSFDAWQREEMKKGR